MWRLAAVYVLLWCVVLWWVLLGCVLLWCDVVLCYAVLYGRRNLTKNPSLKLSGKNKRTKKTKRTKQNQTDQTKQRKPIDFHTSPDSEVVLFCLGFFGVLLVFVVFVGSFGFGPLLFRPPPPSL